MSVYHYAEKHKEVIRNLVQFVQSVSYVACNPFLRDRVESLHLLRGEVEQGAASPKTIQKYHNLLISITRQALLEVSKDLERR